MSWLWNLLLNIPGLAEKFLDYLKVRANVDLEKSKAEVGGDTTIAVARLTAEIEANKAKQAIRQIEGPWGMTAVAGLILFAIPTGVHYWAIVIDSLLVMVDWKIAALPGQLAGVEQQIILSFFITGGAVTIARMFARR